VWDIMTVFHGYLQRPLSTGSEPQVSNCQGCRWATTRAGRQCDAPFSTPRHGGAALHMSSKRENANGAPWNTTRSLAAIYHATHPKMARDCPGRTDCSPSTSFHARPRPRISFGLSHARSSLRLGAAGQPTIGRCLLPYLSEPLHFAGDSRYGILCIHGPWIY